MSIQTEIERIQQAKEEIVNAISDKGIAVPYDASISDMPEYIEQIPDMEEVKVEIAERIAVHDTSDTAHAAIRELFKSGASASEIKAALAELGENYKDLYTLANTLKSFLEARDTADDTINTWREIEDFLQGLTDRDSLTGLMEQEHQKLKEDFEGGMSELDEKITTASKNASTALSNTIFIDKSLTNTNKTAIEAKTLATDAQAAAEAAQSTADNLQVSVNNAHAAAVNAMGAAEEALTTATDARTTADNAASAASEAKTTANSIKTTAEEAQSTAENAALDLEALQDTLYGRPFISADNVFKNSSLVFTRTEIVNKTPQELTISYSFGDDDDNLARIVFVSFNISPQNYPARRIVVPVIPSFDYEDRIQYTVAFNAVSTNNLTECQYCVMVSISRRNDTDWILEVALSSVTGSGSSVPPACTVSAFHMVSIKPFYL